jgi:hypothetical protein
MQGMEREISIALAAPLKALSNVYPDKNVPDKTTFVSLVHGMTIKFANSSGGKCYIQNCLISLRSPSPLGSYAPMPEPDIPFKRIFELVLWSGLQSCRRITPDVISVMKMLSVQYFLYLETDKSQWGLDPVNREGVPAQLFVSY